MDHDDDGSIDWEPDWELEEINREHEKQGKPLPLPHPEVRAFYYRVLTATPERWEKLDKDNKETDPFEFAMARYLELADGTGPTSDKKPESLDKQIGYRAGWALPWEYLDDAVCRVNILQKGQIYRKETVEIWRDFPVLKTALEQNTEFKARIDEIVAGCDMFMEELNHNTKGPHAMIEGYNMIFKQNKDTPQRSSEAEQLFLTLITYLQYIEMFCRGELFTKNLTDEAKAFFYNPNVNFRDMPRYSWNEDLQSRHEPYNFEYNTIADATRARARPWSRVN